MTGRPLNKHSKYVNCITFPYEMVNEEIITFHFLKREKPCSSWDSPKLIGNRSHRIPLVAVLERKWVLYLAHSAFTCTVQFCWYIVGSTFIGFCSSACSARSAKTRRSCWGRKPQGMPLKTKGFSLPGRKRVVMWFTALFSLRLLYDVLLEGLCRW